MACDKPWYLQDKGVSNYVLYADLPTSLQERVKTASAEIFDEYKDVLHRNPFGIPPWGGDPDYPHITLAYGPPILQKNGEIHTVEEINDVYPNLFKMFATQPEVLIKDINTFNSGWATVIKISYSSPQLNKVRKQLRNNIYVGRCEPDDSDRVKILDERETAFEVRDGYAPGSPDYPWAHTTLALVKPDAPKEIVDAIILKLKTKFSDLIGKKETVDSISVITAITDTRLIAKKWAVEGGRRRKHNKSKRKNVGMFRSRRNKRFLK